VHACTSSCTHVCAYDIFYEVLTHHFCRQVKSQANSFSCAPQRLHRLHLARIDLIPKFVAYGVYHKPYRNPTSASIQQIINLQSLYTESLTWAVNLPFILFQRHTECVWVYASICPTFKMTEPPKTLCSSCCCISKCWFHQFVSSDYYLSVVLAKFNTCLPLSQQTLNTHSDCQQAVNIVRHMHSASYLQLISSWHILIRHSVQLQPCGI
jgi:hypothetical protein